MDKRFVRTLLILVCGTAMALVAYAGQIGYKEDGSLELLRMPRGESIHVSLQDGLLLDYHLLPPPASSPAQPTELVLYLSGARQGLCDEASVIYHISGPRGSELQVRAQPARGRYGADIYFTAPGRYQVATEIQTPRGTINDRFDYEML
ncbi:hypothetical protein [Trichloromonas sp.]|uniref:hypothetical protein n=1 Tax=Trichloromonas sp. TaxID=3069249 RepID=UPI003D819460